MNDTFKQLYEDIEKEARQEAKASVTRKGYDTTGYGYQWIVDRFNNILADSWGFEWKIIKELTGKYSNGHPYHEITVSISIWIDKKENARSCVGGHTASNYYDALKGAITNGFKKTAAFWGVGYKAFRGQIDDDAILPDNDENKTITKKSTQELETKKAVEKLESIKQEIIVLMQSECFKDDDLITAFNKAKTYEDYKYLYESYKKEYNKRTGKKIINESKDDQQEIMY